MRISENYTDWRESYLRDVEVAQGELIRKNFGNEQGKVLCDFYVLPAHNHQTFYARAVSERGFYKVIFAKALQNSIWFHDPIYMYTFDEAKRFEDHPMRQGRIICRAGLIDKVLINRVIATMYLLSEQQLAAAVEPTSDAVFTAIRLYEGGRVIKQVFFTEAEKLLFDDGAIHAEEVRFLSELYLMLEKFIGIGG